MRAKPQHGRDGGGERGPLGGIAKDDDKEFADVTLVERFYSHIINWLEGEGRGLKSSSSTTR